jgi:hypothetical protein
MLQECAVDPMAISTSLDRFSNLLDRFGLDKGRVISQFPEEWFQRVLDLCIPLGDMEKKRITERLLQAKGTKVIRYSRPYSDRIGDWLGNAISQHQLNKFHAIVAAQMVNGVDEIVLPEDVNDGNPLFRPAHGATCQREAFALAKLLAPFLRPCKAILFVDKFYNPAIDRWRHPLRRILAAIASGRYRVERFEFHFLEHRDTMSLDQIERGAAELFRGVLPNGVTMRFFCWRERPGGEEFHARYVLTEKVGILIDAGLSAGKAGETTDWSLLTPEALTQRWDALQLESQIYELVQPPLDVNYRGECQRVSVGEK